MKNRKYRIQKDLVFITTSMCIIVFLWIGFNIYDIYVASTIDEVLQTQIIPIEGRFNVNVIEKLKTRNILLPDYTEASPSGNTITESEIPVEPIDIASPSSSNSINTQQSIENADLENQ